MSIYNMFLWGSKKNVMWIPLLSGVMTLKSEGTDQRAC